MHLSEDKQKRQAQSMNDPKQLQQALEKFVLDTQGISELEKAFGGFNIFEALGHTQSEERHSNFLAFLLNPRAPHGLGDLVLRELIFCAIKSVNPKDRPVEILHLSVTDLSQTLVLREHQNIDIFGINDEEKILLIVENKVKSSEHSNQLSRYRTHAESQYPNYQKIYIYLTPEGDSPSDDQYVPVSYSDVLFLLAGIRNTQGDSISERVLNTLDDYLEILRRHVVSDERLIEQARAIYQRHKQALDFIFEQRPDLQSDLSDFLEGLVTESKIFHLDRKTKTYVNFAPVEWKAIGAFNTTPENKWTKTGRTLLLEFINRPTSLNLNLIIGPTDAQSFREDLFNYSKSMPDVFKGGSPKLYDQFVTILSRKVLTRQHLEDSNLEDLEPKIRKAWQDFLERDLLLLNDALLARYGNAD